LARKVVALKLRVSATIRRPQPLGADDERPYASPPGFAAGSPAILSVEDAAASGRPVLTMRTPSAAALLLGLIPFAAMCFSVPLWDRIDPLLFGIPFNLFWLIAWIVLSSVCLWGAYRLDAARYARDRPTP
jgi:hypothetical protein